MTRRDRRVNGGRGRAALAAALLLAACSGSGDPPRAGTASSPPEATPVLVDSAASAPPPIPGAERPDTFAAYLVIEGMREPTTFRLYRSPEGFALPFSTYLAPDVVAEAAASDEAQSIRFVANFGGERNEEVYLSVHVPQGELSAQEATERARQVAASLGAPPQGGGVGIPRWALTSFTFRGSGGRMGRVDLGRHAGRYFYVVFHHRGAAAEGFAPRAQRILDDWRWAEGGGLGT